MKSAAANLDFERAASIRDTVKIAAQPRARAHEPPGWAVMRC